jgi:hypothetical protein
MALLAERITNAFGTAKGKRPPTVKDFLPDWGAAAEGEFVGDAEEPADPPGDYR